MTVALASAIPVLRIFPVGKAQELRLDFLSFKTGRERCFGDNFPLYPQISRGDGGRHPSEHHGCGTPDARVFVSLQGSGELHHGIAARNDKYTRPGIENAPWNASWNTPWNARTLSAANPFASHLTFNEPNAA